MAILRSGHFTFELFAPPDGRDGRMFTSRPGGSVTPEVDGAPPRQQPGDRAERLARRRRQRRPARWAATRASAARGVALQEAEGIVRSYDGCHAECERLLWSQWPLGGRASSKAVNACVAEGSSPPPEPFDKDARSRWRRASVARGPPSPRQAWGMPRVAVVGYFFSYFARRSRGPSILAATTRCAVLEVRGGRAWARRRDRVHAVRDGARKVTDTSPGHVEGGRHALDGRRHALVVAPCRIVRARERAPHMTRSAFAAWPGAGGLSRIVVGLIVIGVVARSGRGTRRCLRTTRSSAPCPATPRAAHGGRAAWAGLLRLRILGPPWRPITLPPSAAQREPCAHRGVGTARACRSRTAGRVLWCCVPPRFLVDFTLRFT